MTISIPRNLLLLFLALFLYGCGAIRVHQNLEQPTGQPLTASIGGKLFRINKSGDLPNAVGGRDIFGGQVDRGYMDLRLAGIEGAILLLEVTDVDKSSSLTTMNRFKQNAQISIENKVTIGNQEQQEPHTTIRFDTTKQKDLTFGSVKVIFITVQPYSIQYILEEVGK